MRPSPSPRSAGLVLLLVALALTGWGVPAGAGALSHGLSPPALSAPPAAESGPTLVAGGFQPAPGVSRLGPLANATPLTLLVGLPSRDPGGLTAFENAAYVPGTGAYHQFLSPAQVASRFGAAPATVATDEQYFAAHGLSTDESPDGLILTVSGPAGRVAEAFGTSFSSYRSADGRTFFSHATAATLPSGVSVSGVLGLGNVTQPRPTVVATSPPPRSSPPVAGCTTGPSGLSPCQIWGAYDTAGLIANGTNGTGERIAIVDAYDAGEPQTQLESDLGDFDSIFGLPNASVSYNYPVPTTQALNSTYTGWAVEEALDVEWSHASAPGASIVMTFAPNSGVGLYLAVDWIVAHHLADVLSLSWGEPDVGVFNAYSGACLSECNASTDGSYEILSPVLTAATVEGIGVFVATGDCGAADGTSGVSTDFPASDPSAVAVGGTYLSVSDTGTWQGEVGWSGNASGKSAPGCQNQGGSGGGYSPFPRPYWQAGPGLPTVPSTRGTPDVAADASDGVTLVQGSGEGSVGGTSLATPLWAGFAAIADQYAGHALGDLDPGLYAVFRSANYSSDFHDVTSGNNGYSAGTGWNPVAGVGTPIVAQLLRNLVTSTPSPSNLSALLYANATYGPVGLSVRFAVAASGGSGTYPLEGVYFGDGNSSLAVNGIATHTYAAAGVFPAAAFVADSTGNLTASYPLAIVVGGGRPLNVTLVPSTSTPAAGAPVTFTAEVHGGTAPYQFLYTYGDGTLLNFTTDASPTHSYAVPGGYCAVVIAEDAAKPVDGARSAPVPIAVGGATAPVCSNASAPLTVTAEASPPDRDAPADFPSLFTVAGGVSGPGGSGVSRVLSSSDPYVGACQCTVFRSPGSYAVSLAVTDLIGSRASNTTEVVVTPALQGTFTASARFGVAPLTVEFGVALSGGYRPDPNATHWEFGDGDGATGTTVTHVYPTPGLYAATGVASDAGDGNASEGFLIDVLPTGETVRPVLTATFAPAVNISSGTTVHFAATSLWSNGSAAPAQLAWSLGENASAWGPNASLTYYAVSSGPLRNLDASLTAVRGGGGGTTETYLVSPQLFAEETGGFVPEASALRLSATGGPASTTVGLPWSGAARADGPSGPSVGWAWGDGTTNSTLAAAHVYATPGNYTVELTGTDPWNDSASLPFAVGVGPAVLPPFVVTGGPSTEGGPAPLTVSFTGNASGGTGPYAFSWQAGDGTDGANATFVHTYTAAGSYRATVTVTDAANRVDRLNWTIVVTAGPASGSGGGSSDYVYLVLGAVLGVAVGLAATFWDRLRPPPGR